MRVAIALVLIFSMAACGTVAGVGKDLQDSSQVVHGWISGDK